MKQLFFLILSIVINSSFVKSLIITQLIGSLLIPKNNINCMKCKHFIKEIYSKTNNSIIKPLPSSIGYCKLALDINSPPMIKKYKSVEEFRSDIINDQSHIDIDKTDDNNCGVNGTFFTQLNN